jgi:hypothetical protein
MFWQRVTLLAMQKEATVHGDTSFEISQFSGPRRFRVTSTRISFYVTRFSNAAMA